MIGKAPSGPGSVGDQMARVTAAVFGDQVARLVARAFCSGPVTRTDLLAAAVAAHAPSPVFDALLRLPERRYYDVFDLQGQLMSRPT